MATLQVTDATASGQKLHTFTLDQLTERLTEDAKIKDPTILSQIQRA